MRYVVILTCLFLFLLVSSASPLRAADAAEIKAFAKDLKNKDPKIRIKAANELGKIGSDAADVSKELCDALLDSNPAVGLAVYNALEKVRPDLHKPIAKIMLDMNSEKRAEGVADLGTMAADAKPASFFLVTLLTRMAAEDVAKKRIGKLEVRTVQNTAYEALRRIALDDPEVVKQIKALAGPAMRSTGHRHNAMEFLIAWAAEEEDRRKELLPLIKSGLETPGLELAHINLAGAYGALSKDFLPALKKYKLSSNTTIRDAATKAVESIENAMK